MYKETILIISQFQTIFVNDALQLTLQFFL